MPSLLPKTSLDTKFTAQMTSLPTAITKYPRMNHFQRKYIRLAYGLGDSRAWCKVSLALVKVSWYKGS